MSAFFDNAPLLKDKNTISIHYRREPMGDNNCGAFFKQLLGGYLQISLGASVDTRGGLIKEQNWWVEEQGACEGK